MNAASATPAASPTAPRTIQIVRVPSASHPGTTHEVHLCPDGKVTCTCAGFFFCGRCRHVRYVLPRAHCCHCGVEYAYSDASFETRCYCPSCRTFPRRAA